MSEWSLGLPELETIELGENALRFKNNSSSELIMRGASNEMAWRIDLFRLTTISTKEKSESFRYPYRVIVKSGHSASSITHRCSECLNDHITLLILLSSESRNREWLLFVFLIDSGVTDSWRETC